MSDITSKFLMPEFTIDSMINDSGKVINVGIKRMYDIAYEIHDSIMQWSGPGCLAGDVVIRGHWSGKKSYTSRKGVKIENIYKHQHGIKHHGSYQIKSTDFIVKSYNEETGLIEDTTVTSTYSGKKQCYLVKTSSKQIEVTEEHPFLTEKGWIECRELKVGMAVYVHSNKSAGLVKTSKAETKKYDDEVVVKYHPTGSKRVVNGYTYYRKAKYIIEYEANRNNMSYEEYVARLNNEDKTLYFVPNGMQLHHIDRNRANNSVENVQLLTVAEHSRLHMKEDRINTSKPVLEEIISIEPTSIKDTYDLTCKKNHNFFGNDILVHNCGKSQAVQQWNRKKFEQDKNWNPDICDIRLSMKEPVDLVGVPVPTQIDGQMRTVWCIPSVWPEDGKFSGGVIHLDEMNQGQPAILNAAFQLIQDRRLGDYKVPDNYLIIASSNPPAFNATVSDFSIPLANRFSHFNIKVDFNSWLTHEMNNNGNLDVMSFLKTQDTSLLLDKINMENKVGSLKDTLFTDVFVTPRSWEVVGKVLDLPNDKFTMQEKQAYCTGRLGSALSSRLFEYIRNKEKYQGWHEILVDGKQFRNESQDQFWAVQMSCLNAIIGEKDDGVCRRYILNYVKALNNLTVKELKASCLIQLSRSERCAGNLDLFNPRTDAPELVLLLTRAVED